MKVERADVPSERMYRRLVAAFQYQFKRINPPIYAAMQLSLVRQTRDGNEKVTFTNEAKTDSFRRGQLPCIDQTMVILELCCRNPY